MSYTLILLLSLLFPLLVKGQVPSTWSSTGRYTSGALALDGNGVTYMAQKDVSAGTALSNTTYWKSVDSAAPSSAPSTSAPTSTPESTLVPKTVEASPVAQMQVSSSKDHNQSDECCAGEDLHKEDHEKAGPSPSQPNGPGYVDYKLEWEKAKKDLVVVNQRITEERER